MKPDRWLKIKEIFQAALERAPAERSEFVSQACGGDEEMRKEVESLISSDGYSGTFLDSPAYEAAAESLFNQKSELAPGQTIASYEILSWIFLVARWQNLVCTRGIQLRDAVLITDSK